MDNIVISPGPASDPDAEHDEMVLKARALLAAVGGTLVDERELAAARR